MISILATNLTYIFHNARRHTRTLITQHGSALAAFQQHPEGQQNDEQINSLENLVPHINVPAKFNQDMSKSACERRSRLLREWRARQRIELVRPSEMPQERSNRLCRERRTIQQAAARAQPSLSNDALQLFGDEDVSALARWDCGEMDTICGFCNAKMWIKK